MRQETPQEKAYHGMLSPDLVANAHVSFGHQENLRIIQTLNEGRLLEQIFWTVPKVGPCFILKALLFKEFAEISCS